MVLRSVLRIITNLVVALVAILAALGLMEVTARLLPSPFQGPEPSAEVCDPDYGWRGRAGYETGVATESYFHTLSLNSRGMHDTEHPKQKPEDTYRILALGDSFVRAHQVAEAETAHQVLEDWLNRNAAPPQFEVISAGVDAWGTGQELLYYRQEGREYAPDMVLLFLYLGNDIKDNLPGRGLTLGDRNCYTPYFTLCDGQLDPEPWLNAPGLTPAMGHCSVAGKLAAGILGRLHQYSRLYTLVEPLLIPDLPQASALDFYTQNPTFEYGLRLTLALVKELATEVEQDGANFRVVLISPDDLIEFEMMSAEERQAVYERLPLMRRAEEMPTPNEVVAEALTNSGIAVLDLLPAFTEELDRSGQPLYFSQDKHWNVAGNEVAGQVVGRWLQQTTKFDLSSH